MEGLVLGMAVSGQLNCNWLRLNLTIARRPGGAVNVDGHVHFNLLTKYKRNKKHADY